MKRHSTNFTKRSKGEGSIVILSDSEGSGFMHTDLHCGSAPVRSFAIAQEDKLPND